MAQRKTHEKFVQEVYDLVGDEYTVLGKYKNTSTHIKMKHNICGHEWNVVPRNFLHGTRCPKCFGNIRKTYDEFVKEVYQLVGDEYTIISKEYKNNRTKIKFKHNKCNHEFEMRPHHFINLGQRCPKCFGTPKKTTEQFKKEVYDLVGNEYEVLSEYYDINTKVKMRHIICGFIWNVTPNSFLLGSRCPFCSKKLKKTTEMFKKEVFDLVGNDYIVLDEYVNAHTKVKFKHIACNNIFRMKPNSFLTGQRCPKCRQSKAEKKIMDILDKQKINYIAQYKFKDCKNKRLLPFDFAIFDSNNNLKFLIEYDGEQHFKPWRFKDDVKAKEKLKKVQHNDYIKNTYCLKNNIPLLRIPYWEFNNLETIITQELIKHNLINSLLKGGDHQKITAFY